MQSSSAVLVGSRVSCSRSKAHAAVRIRYLQHSHGDSTVLHWRPGQPVEDRQMSEVMWKDDGGLDGGTLGDGHKKKKKK